jgi:shikimate 5-dehydrogenase
MKQYYSVSQYPGKNGQFFYSKFFEYYEIEASYTPIGTTLLSNTLNEIKSLASGISVSMPFKNEIIDFLDIKDLAVENYLVCNTINVINSQLHGFNCDLEGVKFLSKKINSSSSISVLGNGCIGKMFSKYLNDRKPVIFSRSLSNWEDRHKNNEVIINCTSLGTSHPESPLKYIPKKTKLIIDLSLLNNDLEKLCFANQITYINGFEFYKAQFLKQFEIYTNIVPDPNYFDSIYQKKNQ